MDPFFLWSAHKKGWGMLTFAGRIEERVCMARTLRKLDPPSTVSYMLYQKRHFLKRKVPYLGRFQMNECLDVSTGGTYPVSALLYSFPDEAEALMASVELHISPKSAAADPKGEYTFKKIPLNSDTDLNTTIDNIPFANIYVRVVANGELTTNQIARIAFRYSITRVRDEASWAMVRKRSDPSTSSEGATVVRNDLR